MGSVRRAKLHVNGAVPEKLRADRTGRTQQPVRDPAVLPVIDITTVKEDHRTRRGLCAKSRALPLHLLESHSLATLGFYIENTVCDFTAVFAVSFRRKLAGGTEFRSAPGHVALPARGRNEGGLATTGFAVQQALPLAVPTSPGKTARVEHRLKSTLVEGNHLGTEAFSRIFTLILVVGGQIGILEVGVGPTKFLGGCGKEGRGSQGRAGRAA